MDIVSAIEGRACVRAYLDKPVSSELINNILNSARWTPSGSNTQPWQVAVVTGQSKQKVTKAILAARKQGQAPNPDYFYYPQVWRDPYKSRRFQCGMALYSALHIERDDRARREQVWEWNYNFFDAPVGLLFFIDADLETGSWMDMGMFLQNVMLLARAQGLETCPQAALAEYPDCVRAVLQRSPQQKLLCGMALGYADWSHPINQYRTTRETVEQFTQWYE